MKPDYTKKAVIDWKKQEALRKLSNVHYKKYQHYEKLSEEEYEVPAQTIADYYSQPDILSQINQGGRQNARVEQEGRCIEIFWENQFMITYGIRIYFDFKITILSFHIEIDLRVIGHTRECNYKDIDSFPQGNCTYQQIIDIVNNELKISDTQNNA